MFEKLTYVTGSDTYTYVILEGANSDGTDGAAVKYASPASAPASVKIPSNVDGIPVIRIDTEAFMNAAALTSVSVPDTVKEIGARAFKGCTALTSLTSYSAS